jgi:iron complex outermembrane receptor protein
MNQMPRYHNSSFIIKLSFFCLLIFSLSIAAYAGSGGIRGSVKSGDVPIVGATVRIPELDRLSRTGGNGEFEFPNIPNGTYKVFVRAIGYALAMNSVQVADNSVETNFSLHETVIQEEEIVVSASPYARPADEQYQSSESKSLTELHESSGSSFAEKISDLPGVSVRYNGSAPARPMLRGLTDNEVLILENGLRTGDISTYDPAHSVPIEEQSISQIDIVRGPASIMFGPNAIGGLVNVFTNTIPTASVNPFSGTVSLEGNTVSDLYSGYFNGVFSSGGHAIGISGAGVHSQDIRIPDGSYTDPGSGKVFDLSRMPQSFNHTSEAGLGYSYQSDFGMIGIGGKHYEMNYGIPGIPPNPDWMDVPPATSRIMQRKNNVEIRGLFNIEDSFIKDVKFNAGFVDYYHAEYPVAQDSTGISDPEANNFHKQTINATLQIQHRQSESFQGTIGFWANNEDLTIGGDQPLGPKSMTTGLAGYLFEEYLPGEDTRFQVAVRFDYNYIHASPDPNSTDSVFQTFEATRTANAVTASLGAIQKLTPELTATLNIGRSFRAPTVQELFANGLDAPSGTYTIGDANLSPETGLGVDASLKGSFETFSFELSPYVNFINNYLYSYLRGDTLMDFPVRIFSSTDARLVGFEATTTVRVAQNLGVKASAGYVNSEDTKNNVPLPFTPPLRGLFRVSYQDNVYSGMFEWRLAASQTRLGDGETPTEGYGIVNLSAGIRFTQSGLVHSVSVHCDNLLNQVYRDNLSVIKDFIPQPARGFRMNYILTF